MVESISSPLRKRGRFAFEVVHNPLLCVDHHRLTLRACGAFPPMRAGQFVQLEMDDESPADAVIDWDADGPPPVHRLRAAAASIGPLLRRPFSPSGRRDVDGVAELELIYRVVGVGTLAMTRLAAGDQLSLIGPLGRPFELPPAGTPAILVGGGVGIPPMIYLAAELAAAGRAAVAVCGATTRSLLPLTIEQPSPTPDDATPRLVAREFAAVGVRSIVCTDDGSFGFRGFCTQAMERHLDAHPGNRPWIYACGPEPMLRRVADIAVARELRCQVAVERAMACGMGTCQSCVIRIADAATSSGWRYQLACTDGPVFDAPTLLW